ncbi:MAG: alpha/beta hydrolase [Cryobacterium sp.]
MIVPSPFSAALTRIPRRTGALVVLGADTRYWDYGPVDAGTTIILVHGFRGDHHGLEPVVAQNLADTRLVSPDLPGFGASAAFIDRPHDIAAYAQWLAAFVSALAPSGRVVLLGHSFGSIIVSAAVAGGLTGHAVILVNPIAAPALAGPRGVLTRLAVFYYWAGARLGDRFGFALLRNRVIVRVMSISMAKTRDHQLRRWIHAEHDRYFSAFSSRQVVLEAFTASVSHDVSEYAGMVPVPTLLIAADRDDITPLAAQHRLVTLFPRAQLSVIDGVGHLIHYEKPAVAAAAIARFLADPT